MICDICKKFFLPGNRPNGIPNGVKMIQKNGKSITICSECVISIGKMDEKERAEFFDRLKEKGEKADGRRN